MRWLLWIAVALVLLLAAYTVWPLIGLYSIGSAVESRDAAALAERVNFRSLRRHLARQVIEEYLRLTGREKKLGRVGTGIATGVGASLAEPAIAQYLNPETLLDLLHKGDVGGRTQASSHVAPFSTSSWRSAWDVWWNSQYLGRDFYVYLPPEKPKDEQHRVRLSLQGWQWKLTGIDLPDTLRVELAQELVRRERGSQE